MIAWPASTRREGPGFRAVKIGFFYAAALAILALFLFPIAWLLLASVKTQIDAIALPPVWWFQPTLDNFRTIFGEERFLHFLANSLVVAVVSTLLSLLVGFPAAYALARYRFRLRNDIAFWVISTQMLPPIAVALPYLLLMKSLGLIDTKTGLVIAHLTFNLPFAVWLLQGFIREVPPELDEAATVDGASVLRVMRDVVAPLVKPGLLATSIFCIITSWNEFMFALFLAPFEAKTLPVASVGLISFGSIYWGQIGAAASVIVVPVFLFALAAQRYLVRGLSFGAVKG